MMLWKRILVFALAWVCNFLMVQAGEPSGEPPLPSKGDPATAKLVAWSGNAGERAVGPEGGRQVLRQFATVLEHLNGISGEKTLANPRFAADRQIITRDYWKVIHDWGRAQVGPTADPKANANGEALAAELLAALEAGAAPGQYRLPFLARLGRHAEFYSELRRDLELSISFPERLNVELEIPPSFRFPENLPPAVLLDALSVYDLCRQRGWLPGEEEERAILGEIARRLEAAGRTPYALTALKMITEENRGAVEKAGIARLEQKIREHQLD